MLMILRMSDLLRHNWRDFWTEVKKIRQKKASVSSIVDGVCTDGIADLFANQHL